MQGNKLFWMLFAFSTFLVIGCRNSSGDSADPTEVNLNVRLTYEDEPLVFEKDSLLYLANQSLIFESFKIFFSDAKIYADDGTGSIALFEIEMLDFSSLNTESLAENGLDVLIRGIPSGSYDRIDIGIGVEPDLNQTLPSEYGGNHALSNADMYNNSIQGYRFWALAGRADVNGDNDFSDLNFNYNNYGDQYYIPRLKFYRDIEFFADVTGELNFELDLKKLLDGSSGSIDIEDMPLTTVDNIDSLAEIFNANFENALILKP